jgi:hypothetical protein
MGTKQELRLQEEDEQTLHALLNQTSDGASMQPENRSRLALEEETVVSPAEKQKNELTPEMISKYLRAKLAKETRVGLTWQERMEGWDILDGVGPWVDPEIMRDQLPVLGIWMQIRDNMELLKELAEEMEGRKVGWRYMAELLTKALLGKRRKMFDSVVQEAREEFGVLASAGVTPEKWSKARRERLVQKYQLLQAETLRLMQKLDQDIENEEVLIKEKILYPDITSGLYFK